MLMWNHLNTHLSRKMRRHLAARRDWLTVYAPDLNAVENACAYLISDLTTSSSTAWKTSKAPSPTDSETPTYSPASSPTPACPSNRANPENSISVTASRRPVPRTNLMRWHT